MFIDDLSRDVQVVLSLYTVYSQYFGIHVWFRQGSEAQRINFWLPSTTTAVTWPLAKGGRGQGPDPCSKSGQDWTRVNHYTSSQDTQRLGLCSPSSCGIFRVSATRRCRWTLFSISLLSSMLDSWKFSWRVMDVWTGCLLFWVWFSATRLLFELWGADLIL